MKPASGFALALATTSPALAHGLPKEVAARDAVSINVAVDSPDPDAACEEGRALLAAGDPLKAISAFRAALAQKPLSVAALNGIAVAYDRLGRSDLARQNFELALSIEPDAADVTYNLGWSLVRAGEDRAAIPFLQRAAAGSDARAAAAGRRALALIAARLAAPIAAAPIATAPAPALAPVFAQAARIEMASSGEAVLVLPEIRQQAAKGPAPVAMAAAAFAAPPAPNLAPPDAPLITALADGGAGLSPDNAPPVANMDPARLADPALLAPAIAPVQSLAMLAERLGDAAALTIPMPELPIADDSVQPAPELISLDDQPPQMPTAAAAIPAAAPAAKSLLPPQSAPSAAPPTVLPVAQVAPPAHQPLLPSPSMLLGWLGSRPRPAILAANTNATSATDTARLRAHGPPLAPAPAAPGDDKAAIRLAIARLELLVAQIEANDA